MSFLKFWKSNGHKKLSTKDCTTSEKDLYDCFPDEGGQDIVDENDGTGDITFNLKYLGSTVVTQSEELDGKIQNTNFVKLNRRISKKSQPVQLCISTKGLVILNPTDATPIIQVSIYRVSNCCTHDTYRNVFFFISTDHNEITEQHAFLCPKAKVAKMVTLAVANAFAAAYEFWRLLPETQKNLQPLMSSTALPRKITNDNERSEQIRNMSSHCLIDLGSEDTDDSQWVSFDDDNHHFMVHNN